MLNLKNNGLDKHAKGMSLHSGYFDTPPLHQHTLVHINHCRTASAPRARRPCGKLSGISLLTCRLSYHHHRAARVPALRRVAQVHRHQTGDVTDTAAHGVHHMSHRLGAADAHVRYHRAAVRNCCENCIGRANSSHIFILLKFTPQR